MKLWIKIVIGIFAALFILIGAYVVTHSGFGIDRNNLPQFIQADFVDLSKMYSISKFRSGEGHDFSGGGETCRSMKHYFMPQYDVTVDTYLRSHNGIPPPPNGKTDIPIYSPVDGRITSISEEHTPIGKQISIQPSHATQFNVRLFHIYPLDGITAFAKVKAGQQIGVIGKNQGTDISVQLGGMPWNNTFVSYFEVMPDGVFAAYTARGATSRRDFIFTKAYRDANPFQCATDDSEAFIHPANYDQTRDDVHLSGYTAPNYGQQNSGQNQNNNAAPQNYGSNAFQGQQNGSATQSQSTPTGQTQQY